MNKLFDELSVPIKIYVGVEEIQDPYEKNIKETLLTPIPIRAIVTDLSNTKVQYAMPGIETSKSKEIIIRKIHKDMLVMSRKIKIDGDFYEGWKVSGRLQFRTEGSFIRAYVYIKKV